jgi:protein SCO1/2
MFSLSLILAGSAFSQAEVKKQNLAESYFTNTLITDQNGNNLQLYSDILKDKTVIISSFSTTCQGACPVISRTLQKIQEAFPDNLGKDLFIVSITLDSETDTIEKLDEYARKLEAKSGWLFLTGDKKKVDFVLKKFGLYSDSKEKHKNTLIIGKEKTGLWKKAFGLADEKDLIKIVKSVLNDKGVEDQTK